MSEDKYCIMTFDIVGSKIQKNNQIFDQEMKQKIDRLNNAIESLGINQKFNISRGDEIQIMCPMNKNVAKLLLLTLAMIRPYKARFVANLGEYKGELLENTWNMNGPIFWDAREAMQEITQLKRTCGRIVGGTKTIEKIGNKLLDETVKWIDKVSDIQWTIIENKILNKKAAEILDIVGVKQSTYYYHLKKSRHEDIIENLEIIFEAMAENSTK